MIQNNKYLFKKCKTSEYKFVKWLKYNNIKHYFSLNHTEQDNKIFNIDNVRKYIKELKMWMKKFKGVASRYLDLYLSWFKSLDSGAFDKAAAGY